MNDSTILKLAIIVGATITLCVGSCCAVRWKALAEGYSEQEQPSGERGTSTNWVKKEAK